MIVNSDIIYKEGFRLRQHDFGLSIILEKSCFQSKRLTEETLSFLRQNSIEGIEVNYIFGFDLSDIVFLCDATWIRYIHIIKDNLDLTGLKFAISLSELYVSKNDYPIDFSCFTSLERLDMKWNANRCSLFEQTSLKHVVLRNYNKLNFLEFKNLKNLESLELIQSSVKNLEFLSELDRLKHFAISYNRFITNLNDLIRCKSLQSVSFQNIPNLSNIEALAEITGLTSVIFENCKKIEKPERLFGLFNLEVFGFVNSGPLKSLRGIEKMSMLRSFHIGSTTVVDKDMSHILKLKKVKRVFYREKRGYSHTQDEINRALGI